MKPPRTATIARVAVIGVVAALVTLSVGSAAGEAGTASSRAAHGSTFTYSVSYDLGSLNPYLTSLGATNTFDGFLYGTMLSITAQGKPQAELAQKWSATTTKATFTLRAGLTCSDGTALSASQVAADINWIAKPSNGSTILGQYVQANSQATANDAKRTVTIRSGKPDAFLLDDLGSVPIVCRAGLANPKLLAAGKAGTGPYAIASISAGNSYTVKLRSGFKAGPGTWKSTLPGVPRTVVAQVVTNNTTAANLLLSGKLNAAAVTGPDAQRLAAKNLFRANGYSPAGEFMFNQAAGHPGSSLTVRKAIVQALDLMAVGRVLSGGLGGKPATQMLEGDNPNLCPGNTVAGNLPSTDVAAAGSLLDKAGWKAGSGGTRSNNGTPLAISLMYFNSQGEETAAAEFIAAQLEALGIKVTLNMVDGPAFGSATSTGNWDMFLASGVWQNPSAMVGSFQGPDFEQKGANLSDTNNPTYDALVAKASKIPGTRGCSVWNQAEAALIRDVDIVPFYEVATPVFGNRARFSLAQYPWSIRLT